MPSSRAHAPVETLAEAVLHRLSWRSVAGQSNNNGRRAEFLGTRGADLPRAAMRSLGLAFSRGRGNLPTLECLTGAFALRRGARPKRKAPKASENDARCAALAFELEQERRENAALKKSRERKGPRAAARAMAGCGANVG